MTQLTADSVSFVDPEVARCPFDAYSQLQGEQPVYLDPKSGLYEVTSAAEVRSVAWDTETFSNVMNRQDRFVPELAQQMEAVYREHGFPLVPTLLNNDPPSHTAIRALVDRAFTLVRINALMPKIRAEIDALLDNLPTAGPFDFVELFAIPLPVHIIADELGVSRSEREVVKAGSDALIGVGDPLTKPEDMLDLARTITRLQKVLADRIEYARRNPDETILSTVANGTVDGKPVELGVLVSLFISILVAGNETTTNGVGNALQFVIDTPSSLDQMRGNPTAVRTFVEEALRLRGPLQGFYRRARKEVELGGVTIPKDALLVLRWGAANIDESVFECAQAFTPGRPNIAQHVAFGHGPHVCLGNQLARAELRATFEAIAERWSEVRLAEVPSGVTWGTNFLMHGRRRMMIEVVERPV